MMLQVYIESRFVCLRCLSCLFFASSCIVAYLSCSPSARYPPRSSHLSATPSSPSRRPALHLSQQPGLGHHVKDSLMAFLLPSYMDAPMRQPSDKDNEACNLDDLFEQYLETDLLQFSSDNTVEPSSSDDFADLFDFSPSNDIEAIETSPIPNRNSGEGSWHKALVSLRQNSASPTLPSSYPSIYPESKGRASFSDPGLFAIDDIFELKLTERRQSLSTSTPKPQFTKPAKKAAQESNRSLSRGVQKAARKFATVPRMMRPSHFRTGIHDMWSRKMDNPVDAFHLGMGINQLSHTPPPSTKMVQDEHTDGFFPQDQPYTIAMSPLSNGETPDLSQTNYQLTPLSSPAIDIDPRNNGAVDPFHIPHDGMGTAYLSHHISNVALSALQTPPSSHRLPANPWGPDTPASLDFGFSTSPEYQSLQAAWNAPGAPQPSQDATYPTTASRSQNSHLSFSSSMAGLGISCDTAAFGGFGPELDPVHASSDFTTPNPASASASFDLPYAPATNAYPALHNHIHIGTPRPSTPPSRSSSQSPVPQPRFSRRRHSSQTHTTRSTHRRKPSNSNSSPGNGNGHGHVRANSGSASVGFVNFTPSDSMRILTGVAPSGSSKTKARREKEAADKRRKLSQAAIRAVTEAGGDLRRLEEGGLLALGGE
jgi:hypothetical protein